MSLGARQALSLAWSHGVSAVYKHENSQKGLLDVLSGPSDYAHRQPLAKAVLKCQVAHGPGLILGLHHIKTPLYCACPTQVQMCRCIIQYVHALHILTPAMSTHNLRQESSFVDPQSSSKRSHCMGL